MKPQIVISFDGEMLRVDLDKRHLAAFRRADLHDSYLEDLLFAFRMLVEGGKDMEESHRLALWSRATAISVANCNLCGRWANLAGGICWNCANPH